ncbi:hypothetical protein [Flexivirga oryzae]|uniref:N-acetyltransferase domain-containing protein n=1 Tax=Flexivirga oryzae TaxID=1794944 RepID=A0A839NDT7_9MICO|nr:hypothetical protein [Flexivirga oryzae]MBB2893335.1 hypothetical protein [Flexivirga oryzae]
MTNDELRRSDVDEACELLQDDPAAYRGFLGLDPIVQNASWMSRRLTQARASVYSCAGQLLGVAPAQQLSDYAQVSMSEAAGAHLPAFLELAEQRYGYRNFITFLDADESPDAFVRSGFQRCGTMRAHHLRDGVQHDVTVYVRIPEEAS